jgi:hypothetical protein
MVSGTDGRNYMNECQLKLASCTQQIQIYVKEKRPCGEFPTIFNVISMCFQCIFI